MVDLEGKDKGNISLPAKLQAPDISDPNFHDDAHRDPIINMQKAFYNIKIVDIDQRIQRIQERNDELMDYCRTTELAIVRKDLESGDEIVRLNRYCNSEETKVEVLKKRIEAVETLRMEEQETHLKNVEFLEKRFLDKQNELQGQLESIKAEIKILEEFRNDKGSIQEKLKAAEELMAQREAEGNSELEQINRKFKLDRETLRKEMHERLLEFAGTLQASFASVLPLPMQRLMRENLMIKNEIFNLAEEDLNERMRNSDRNMSIRGNINATKWSRIETRKHLITMKIYNILLRVLEKCHKRMERSLAKLPKFPMTYQESFIPIVDISKMKAENAGTEMKELEIIFHREQVKLNIAKSRYKKVSQLYHTYLDTVYDLKYAINCMLEETRSEDLEDTCNSRWLKELINILEKCKNVETVTESVESIKHPNEIHRIGDLGIDITGPRPNESKDLQPSATSSLDTFALSTGYTESLDSQVTAVLQKLGVTPSRAYFSQRELLQSFRDRRDTRFDDDIFIPSKTSSSYEDVSISKPKEVLQPEDGISNLKNQESDVILEDNSPIRENFKEEKEENVSFENYKSDSKGSGNYDDLDFEEYQENGE